VLDTQPGGPVTVTATSGTPAKATVSGAVTFTTADWDTAQTFTVTGQDAGTSAISHAASSRDSDYAITTVGTVTVTVTDAPGVTLSTSAVSMAEDATASYTVVLDTQPGGSVTVTATSGTPAKATVSGPVTFTTGNWSTPQTFTVTGQDAGTSAITHAATSDDSNYTNAAIGTVTATVSNAPGVTLSDSEVSLVEGATATYTLRLDTQPADSVAVMVTSAATATATIAPSTVTFTTSDWATPQTVTVTGATAGTTSITHITVSTGDSDYNNLNTDSVTATVANQVTPRGPNPPIVGPPAIETVESPAEEDPVEEEPEEEEPAQEEPETPEQEPAEEEEVEQTLQAEPRYEIMPRNDKCKPENGDAPAPFEDVPESSWAAGDVSCLSHLEVTKGTSETTYSPAEPVTREQMASFLARLFNTVTGEAAPVVETPFTDLPDDSYAYEDVGRIYGLGITKGTSETTYSHDRTVTRGQMASFLARFYARVKGEAAPVVETPFTDVSIDSFAYEDVGRIYGLGITKGTSETTYSDDDPVTREQMAAFLARLYRRLTEPSDAGPSDAGPSDAGPSDDGPSDDAGPSDAGPSDDGPSDDGPSDDAGPSDDGPSDDAGPSDDGPSADAGPDEQ